MAEKFTHLDTGKVETTESFFSCKIITARIDSGHASNQGFDQIFEEDRDPDWEKANWKNIRDNRLNYDEDVNQYITLTLADFVKPQSQDLANKYLVGAESDAGQIAVQTEETSKKYIVYRVNADFLLLYLGLFRYDLNPHAYIDKGSSYYFSAAANLKGIYNGRSALSDVMEKLSIHFRKYVEILRYMRNADDNYLSFHFKFSQLEIESLEKTLTEESRKGKDPGQEK